MQEFQTHAPLSFLSKLLGPAPLPSQPAHELAINIMKCWRQFGGMGTGRLNLAGPQGGHMDDIQEGCPPKLRVQSVSACKPTSKKHYYCHDYVWDAAVALKMRV